MPSFCGAALAIMSRVYRKYDAAYADQCLVHARYAYAYAKAHPGTEGTKDGGFYPANARWQDDYVILTAELYNATGENAFLDEAKAKASNVGDHNFTLCYNNNDDLAAYNLAAVGQADKGILLQKMVARYKGNITAEGVGATGDMWGRLRFPMYQSFAAGLSSKLGGVSAVDPFVVKNIDYVLGKNSTGQSFLVGFGEKSPQHPHHRNVYLSDANGDKTVLTIPVRNKQAGIMVGGTLNPGDFKDYVEAYQFTEGCIDYNAGLVAALGYLLSVVAPVDTTHFTGVSALLNQPKKELPQNDFWMRQETPRFGIDGLGRAKPTASLFQFGFTIPYDKP